MPMIPPVSVVAALIAVLVAPVSLASWLRPVPVLVSLATSVTVALLPRSRLPLRAPETAGVVMVGEGGRTTDPLPVVPVVKLAADGCEQLALPLAATPVA